MSFHVTEGEGGAYIVVSVKSAYDAREAASLSYSQIAEVLSERRMASVHERIFSSLSVEHGVISARRQAFTSFGISPENPVTYVEGNPPWGEGLAGVIIHAVKADEVWTIMDSGVPCGRGWRLNGETHLVLQNITGDNNPPPSPLNLRGEKRGDERSIQTSLMLERAERILRENGASYKDVVRTRFYLSDILEWYAAFNKVRNEKYGEFGIMPGPGDRELLLPASTGIQGETPSGAACAMDLIAVIGNNPEESMHESPSLSFPQSRKHSGVGNHSAKKDSGQAGMTELKFRCGITNDHIGKARPSIRRLANPAQLDAFRYGSAFARASVVRNGSTDIIEVSGTAAIDEHGVSLYPGDIRSQINCTFDKVAELLKQEYAGLKDICTATVFVKQPEFAEIFYEMAAARGLENFPCVCIVADVCREELLFEIDAEAVVKTGVKDSRGRGMKNHAAKLRGILS